MQVGWKKNNTEDSRILNLRPIVFNSRLRSLQMKPAYVDRSEEIRYSIRFSYQKISASSAHGWIQN